MFAHINPVRAISAEFLRRKFMSIVLLFVVFAVLIAIINAVLIGQASVWWWILGGITFIFFIVGVAALLVVRMFIGVLMPALNKEQKTAVRDFVDKFERVSETVSTPWFMIIFKVVWDLVQRREDGGYVVSTIKDSTTLHTDYMELVKHFNNELPGVRNK